MYAKVWDSNAIVWDSHAMVWDSNAILCYAMVYVVTDMLGLTVYALYT